MSERSFCVPAFEGKRTDSDRKWDSGSERSVESPDCLLLYVILKLLLPFTLHSEMCLREGKLVCMGMLAGVLWVCTSSYAAASEYCSGQSKRKAWD